jgi:hypothetical protein
VSRLVFLDTETTGLYPQLGHVPYEIAMIDQDGAEVTLWVQLDRDSLAAADPAGMRIGGYWERYPQQAAYRQFLAAGQEWAAGTLAALAEQEQPLIVDEAAAARIVVWATAGAHLVGVVPSFDAAMLDAMLRRHQLTPAWHYHLVDVEALAAGKLGLPPPWDSDELTAKVGVEVAEKDKHTALGDARWAKATYDAVLGVSA